MSETKLAAWFAQISADLSADLAETPTVQRICERAVELVHPCHEASLTVRRRHGRFETVGTTSELAAELDQTQYELGEGPCLEAAAKHDVFRSDDLGTDPRWPRWGPRVADRGVRSMVAVRLGNGAEVLGAVNLYSHDYRAFDDNDLDVAMVYAIHAANAIRAARLVTGLQTALSTRHQIGAAQGILMERYGLSVDRSFEVLQRYASRTNKKLRDVAAQVVEERRLPGPERTRTIDPGGPG